MIELAERPSETKPPRVPAGWYDPDSSAFEPLARAATMTDEVAASARSTDVARDRDAVVAAAEGRAAR
jgi:hypothetical protein